MTEMSAEVRAMQNADRKRWLSVADAQRLRREWDKAHEALTGLAAKYDENPEDANLARMYIVLTTICISGFGSEAVECAERLRERLGDSSGE